MTKAETLKVLAGELDKYRQRVNATKAQIIETPSGHKDVTYLIRYLQDSCLQLQATLKAIDVVQDD